MVFRAYCSTGWLTSAPEHEVHWYKNFKFRRYEAAIPLNLPSPTCWFRGRPSSNGNIPPYLRRRRQGSLCQKCCSNTTTSAQHSSRCTRDLTSDSIATFRYIHPLVHAWAGHQSRSWLGGVSVPVNKVVSHSMLNDRTRDGRSNKYNTL